MRMFASPWKGTTRERKLSSTYTGIKLIPFPRIPVLRKRRLSLNLPIL
jgi:hypothetical protein